jgi:hypothetical protein
VSLAALLTLLFILRPERRVVSEEIRVISGCGCGLFRS